MATFFGEVLSVYSRAVEEDDEEREENEEDEQIRRELEEKREVHLHWIPEVSDSLKSGNKLPCSEFVLAVGHNAARFLSVYVLTSANWDKVGHASVWNERSRAVTGQTSKESACVFYRHKENPTVLMCQVTSHIAEDQLFQWTEKVFDCLQHRELNVTVLSDSSVADYKTADYLCTSATPFLRSLHTGTFSVLNHCQVHRIATVVYQCYSDILGPDSVTMETYKPALTKLGKSIQLASSPNTDVLRKFIQTTEIQSNLYI
ncbi:proteasome assembly chaperone 1 isoform X2 [Platichthys flesus]|uniref:proteasome assembly chaperone 1 isoform X2 n=1 Tax=Platichthys flesus TaxID=8260 RepID=UPI002DBBF15E|nr:proteasome assembly chaperone 1 isoform X2 [Platichthys flesus]